MDRLLLCELLALAQQFWSMVYLWPGERGGKKKTFPLEI